MSNMNKGVAGDRQRQIFDASVDLFWDKGYYGASMRDLAAAVGIQLSSLYHHNGSKQDLLILIMEQTMHDLTAAVRQASEGAEGVGDQLASAVRAHVLFHGTHPHEAFVTDSEIRALEPENFERVVGLRDEHQALFEDLIARGATSGIFEVPDVKIATYAITTMCTAVSTWFRESGRLTIAEVAHQYAEAALRMVGYRPMSRV